MQINRYTDFSYRVLMYLAINNSKRVTMADIAGFYDISHDHLRKVVHQLSKYGYITTYIGKSGGMELKKKADEINLGQVFIDFEGISPLIDCENTGCPLTSICTLNSTLSEAQTAFVKKLEQTSLADLLKNTEMMNKLKV